MVSLSSETMLFSTVVLVGLLVAVGVRLGGWAGFRTALTSLVLMGAYFWGAAPTGDHAGLAYLLFGTFFAVAIAAGLGAGLVLRILGVPLRVSVALLCGGALVLAVGLAWG